MSVFTCEECIPGKSRVAEQLVTKVTWLVTMVTQLVASGQYLFIKTTISFVTFNKCVHGAPRHDLISSKVTVVTITYQFAVVT